MTGKRFARLAAAVAVCLLVLAAFVVQLLGGRGSVPGWQQLRAVLGVPLQTEESAPQTADGSTVVYVLDVGQGDAVLLCQDGAYCLIDTGPVEAEDALLYDLDVLGVPSLEYLVLTHPPRRPHRQCPRGAAHPPGQDPAAAAVAAHGR